MEAPTTFTAAFRRIGDQFWETVIDVLPRLLTALAIIVAGIVIAKLSAAITRRACDRMRLDSGSDRIGITKLLRRVGYEGTLSQLVANLVRLFVGLLFLNAAIDVLELTRVAQTVAAIVGYLPRVLLAILIVLVGGLVAAFVSRIVKSAAVENAIDFGPAIARLCVVVILTAAGLSALTQIGIDTEVLRVSAAIVVAGAVFCLALTIALGCREVAQNIITGFYSKKLFRPGDEIEIQGHRGQVVAITPIQTVIEDSQGVIVLPNRVYLRSVVRRDHRGGDASR